MRADEADNIDPAVAAEGGDVDRTGCGRHTAGRRRQWGGGDCLVLPGRLLSRVPFLRRGYSLLKVGPDALVVPAHHLHGVAQIQKPLAHH